MFIINDEIAIKEDELELRFTHASGPGGQHVNKASTGVQLRFDVHNSTSLSEEVRDRLILLAGNRVTRDGILIIDASEHRSQEKNRSAAKERLRSLIQEASTAPKQRKQTQPPTRAKEERLREKRRQSEKKKSRKSSDLEFD